MADAGQGVVEVQLLLQWCRENDFRVHEVQSGAVRLIVDDVRAPKVSIVGKRPVEEPEDVYEAWADRLKIPRPARPAADVPEDEGEP